jgi:hypothetical protein
MRAGLFFWRVFVTCVSLLATTACSGQSGWNAALLRQPETRVLFIGNSYTSFNGGLDKGLEALSPSIETERVTADGYTLEDHWNDGNALRRIREGGWSYVVLQEQSQLPVLARRSFLGFARQFDAEIREAGAKTVLLMTWERPDSTSAGVNTANLASAYNSVGTELGALVAPAGLAFARSLHDRPDLALYTSDGHPTREGSYLAACVLYGTISRETPVDNRHSGKGLTAETSAYLQQIAAEVLGF